MEIRRPTHQGSEELKLIFVTTNKYKLAEAMSAAAGTDFDIVASDIVLSEVQNDDLELISKNKAEQAFRILGVPCIVDDTGLFIEEFNGFPGPYTAYVARTLMLEGITSLLNGPAAAQFKTVLTYVDDTSMLSVKEDVDGLLNPNMLGDARLLSDMFIPDRQNHSLSVLTEGLYESPRKKAFRQLFGLLERRKHAGNL